MKYEGLSQPEVQERIDQGKVNGTQKRLTKTKKEIIRDNTITYFNLVNVVLFIIVMLTGRVNNGLFILTTVTNTLIGIYQELKSKKLLDDLNIMNEAEAEVHRDHQWIKIKTENIVTDDLIRLHTGDQIPCDACITEGYLEVNESMLTGEANTIIKKTDSSVYSGTIVTSGEALAKVTHVGRECASAKIMEEAQKDSRAHSQLHDDLDKLIRVISIVIIPVGIILFLTHLIGIGMNWQDAVLKTIAAIVGMIPEGLIVLTSIALAVSVIRLSARKVLVQDLYSIESLARTDTICLDKTGTITSGDMTVSDVIMLTGDMDRNEFKKIMQSYLYGTERPNATGLAMNNYFHPEEIYKKTAELPFSSERKYAGVSLKGKGTYYVGAVSYLFPSGAPLVNHYIDQHTEKGERVVVVAYSARKSISDDELPEDIFPVAMICIRDILRDHVEEIMHYFTRQKVDIKVISGDDPATVSALAGQADIPHAEAYLDLSGFNGEYTDAVKRYTVFGRVRPEQKKMLVEALQANNHTVAMTGDGVNDVPALKKADVSISVAAGSSAAKDSASIVLLNNDFAEIPSVVGEGRRVINNITRASSMYLVKTVFSVLLSLYVIITATEYPFLPIHLSLLSAIGVGVPTFFLQLEPDFEKVSGRFFSKALRNAVPSAVTVMIFALLCMLIRWLFHLSDTEFYGIFVAITAYIYLFTLFRVYYPPTVLRRVVIIAMALCFAFALIGMPSLFTVSYRWIDLAFIIPGMIGSTFMISLIARIYDWIVKKYRELRKND